MLNFDYVNIEEQIHALSERLRYVSCNLSKVIAEEKLKELKRVRAELEPAFLQNQETLLLECNALGIEFILVTGCALVTTRDSARYNGWPAIWQLPINLGMTKGCGNSSNTYVEKTRDLFGSDFLYRLWDVNSQIAVPRSCYVLQGDIRVDLKGGE